MAEVSRMAAAPRKAARQPPSQPVHRGIQPEELYDAAVRIVPGTDELQHENDILLVANAALEQGGVQSIADFADWLGRQEMNAKRSGGWEEDSGNGRFPAPPAIAQIAKWLRFQKAQLARYQ